jgi:transcription elongation factor GreA-like protein
MNKLSGMLISSVLLFYFSDNEGNQPVGLERSVIMNLCGEFVTHKVFGNGQITQFDNNCVTVLFSDLNETKKFIFPTAFGPFLTPVSQSISKQIQAYKDEIVQNLAQFVTAPKEKEIPKKVRKPAKPK